MLKTRLMKVQILFALGAILIASCGAGNVPDATPTYTVNQIQTYAVATFSSALTLTALAAPTSTPAVTLTPLATLPPLATSTGGAVLGVGTAAVGATTASCYGLTFMSDVTIPDNTQLALGRTFTKTWRVQNSGSCAWESGFKFQNTGGNAMGASAVTLSSSVASGATYEISVPMTAPNANGTVRGNWRMATATGQLFGDEVFVQIVVGNGPTPTTYP